MSLPATPLVAPVITLSLWTFIMEFWLYAYRMHDMTTYKITPHPTITKEELNKRIPPHRQWPADNFTHLHEQPTVFYAVALSLALMGVADRATLAAAWGYVGLRVVHSLIQATRNDVFRRWQVFVASSGVLCGLAVRAAVGLVF